MYEALYSRSQTGLHCMSQLTLRNTYASTSTMFSITIPAEVVAM